MAAAFLGDEQGRDLSLHPCRDYDRTRLSQRLPSLGFSATIASVVVISPAIEAASCSAVRTTLVGPMIPLETKSPNWSSCANNMTRSDRRTLARRQFRTLLRRQTPNWQRGSWHQLVRWAARPERRVVCPNSGKW
jgi:hypothetical protein